jgi:hypothetical protein
VQFDGYITRRSLSAEEAAADVEGLGIVIAAALDAVSRVLEARKAVSVDIRYCLSANKLPKVAGKVVPG